MSTPTRELESLSMGPMVSTTRSQGQQGRRQREVRAKQSSSQIAGNPGLVPSIESDAGPSTSYQPVQGRSGLLYDVRQLPRNMVERARAGLSSTDYYIVQDNSHTVEAGLQTRHGIQLRRQTAKRVRPESIRIYNPGNGSQTVDCSCLYYQQIESVCEHQYWLYDGLNAVIARLSPSSMHVVTEENVLNRMTGLYDEIGRYLLDDDLIERLSAGRASEIVSDSDEATTDSDLPPEKQDETTKTIRDMLSVFDRNNLPEDYGADFIGDLPMTFESPEATVNPDSLPATLFGLARHDAVFREHLREALTKDICDLQVFKKLEIKALGTFTRFDNYTESGPFNDCLLADCARRLHEVVGKIIEHKYDRAPLSARNSLKAVQLLLNILNGVCDRDDDIYDELPWQKIELDPEDEKDRNLYTNLIRVSSAGPGSGPCFVLNALGTFSYEERSPLSHRLASILERVEQQGAPGNFTEALREMLRPSDFDERPDLATVQPPPRRLRSRSPSQGKQPETRRRRRNL